MYKIQLGSKGNIYDGTTFDNIFELTDFSP